MKYHTKMINFLFLIVCLFIHSGLVFLKYEPSAHSSNESRINIKLRDSKKIRQIGKKDSQVKEYLAHPSKKSEGKDNSLKQFQVAKSPKLSDFVATKNSALKKAQKEQSLKQASQSRVNYAQRQIMSEAKHIKSDENPLLNHLNYNMKFETPEGIEPHELNELEKVFYSFFKRVAIKYITSIHTSVNDAVGERPYLKNTLRNHPSKTLKAMIRYDKDGNAEVIKILNSSVNDDVHLIFEQALSKMNKIPNITKSLQGKDGTYTAYFQLHLN